ncbi:nitrate reductase molybdenum cofactor assembly chaperone [Haloechinothrix sp. YIM 98757]|uniref:Nitrate reductase molybdenum cofactor assembly chaperone n=1 Tax=Haloechinothrix aidingensis TaxID=2752311 RepID=A0A838ACH4_9PSEU|nr:nitrate reductase molybdenum cofactor assembly chaperone [Haloechinothrix aidingensis]MBA0126885.1 nitrate reductase molybdenum cofactor assembly chaperone [Haloechinothrix aidingensis]
MSHRSTTLQVVSLLLEYPDEEVLGQHTWLAQAARNLPDRHTRENLLRFLDYLTATAPMDLARHYVEVFDLRRRSCLYLTYYLHGDTRKRGTALLALKQSYRAAGLVPPTDELPDFLPMVCEFAALAGPNRGESPLRQHRAGVELIRTALHDTGSAYAHVLDALCLLLPDLSPTGWDRLRRLTREGPPSEEVGLSPYGPPEITHGTEVRT